MRSEHDSDHQSKCESESEHEPPRTTSRTVDVVGAMTFTIVLVLLALRLPKGLDLSDESYYALFVDDWLKGGIHDSSYLVIHQTAALLVLPFAWIFRTVTGSTNGLFLFLRVLFLVGAAASAAITVVALRRLTQVGAWLAGLMLLAFIPFGLPAPSYNTTGQQALTVALAALVGAVSAESPRRRDAWFLLSTAAWTVATIAYAPLGIAGLFVLALVWHFRTDRRFGEVRHLVMACATMTAGWLIVVVVFGVGRLTDGIAYTASLSAPSGLPAKLSAGLDLFSTHPRFSLSCLVALTVGIARRRLPTSVTAIIMGALVVIAAVRPPMLVVVSHDVVTLLALSGVGMLGDLRRSVGWRERLLALVYSTSLVAGLATMLFATNLVFNFCIGAAFAATTASIAAVPSTATPRAMWRPRAMTPGLVAAVSVAILTGVSCTSFYGSPRHTDGPWRRIDDGWFAGVLATPADARLVEVARSVLAPLLPDSTSRLVFIGRTPGLVLLTEARLQMLTSYPTAAPASPSNMPRAVAWSTDYYRDLRHRPPIVVIYRDEYFTPVNPMGPDFLEWYRLTRTEATPIGTLEIYELR